MYRFPHENLETYQLALDIAHWVQQADWPTGLGSIKQQAVRSSASACLNIAEGQGLKGKARVRHYRIALGSTNETAAAIDLMTHAERDQRKEQLGRVARMLLGLIKKG